MFNNKKIADLKRDIERLRDQIKIVEGRYSTLERSAFPNTSDTNANFIHLGYSGVAPKTDFDRLLEYLNLEFAEQDHRKIITKLPKV